jgi:uncharacterized protein (UPF0333 family)
MQRTNPASTIKWFGSLFGILLISAIIGAIYVLIEVTDMSAQLDAMSTAQAITSSTTTTQTGCISKLFTA